VPGILEGTRFAARQRPEIVEARKQQAILKRTAKIDDVARQVVLFCESDSITGQTQVIDSGIFFH